MKHLRYLRPLLLAASFAALLPSVTAEPPILAPALQPFVDDHSLPGAVLLVADKDKILGLEAVGYSNLATKEPMRPDALFWIASMTKPITTTLLMMLVDDGKVSVDDPVAKYLPEFKDQLVATKQDADHPATGPAGAIQGFVIKDNKVDNGSGPLKRPERVMKVRDLLTHMSGISPVKSPRQQTDKDFVPLREAVESYAKIPLTFEPGGSYAYSNHGMDTVGRIIEVASGMSYQNFLNTRLLQPLGMKDTTFWPSDEQVSRLASGYAPDAEHHTLTEVKTFGFFHYPLSNPERQPWPAGGLFSTASDLSLFCRMLLNGGICDGHHYLSMKSLQQMTSTQTGDVLNKGQNEGGYGFGWQTINKLHDNITGLPGPFGHGGAYGTEMWIDPQKPMLRIFMVQMEGGMGGELGGKIKAAFGHAVSELIAASRGQKTSAPGSPVGSGWPAQAVRDSRTSAMTVEQRPVSTPNHNWPSGPRPKENLRHSRAATPEK